MENKVYVISIVRDLPEEDYRHYVNPMQTRRYGRLLKRALATALKCIHDSGIAHPDAIINGTDMGSWEESEHLLDGLATEGEAVSMPTHFMLCTHNTVASLIGIYTHSHGYNNTYSQRGASFESAVLDAFLQLKQGRIRHALVCANDELTPGLRAKMERAGVDPSTVSDRSVAMMLSVDRGEHPLYEITDVELTHRKGSGDSGHIKYVKLCD